MRHSSLPPSKQVNDLRSFVEISLRAGTVVHLPEGEVAAHRDLHFRLLRHNLLADILASTADFLRAGDVSGLKKTVSSSL